jgi:hypothetical protein
LDLNWCIFSRIFHSVQFRHCAIMTSTDTVNRQLKVIGLAHKTHVRVHQICVTNCIEKQYNNTYAVKIPIRKYSPRYSRTPYIKDMKMAKRAHLLAVIAANHRAETSEIPSLHYNRTSLLGSSILFKNI